LQLKKAYCKRQGIQIDHVRFLFDGDALADGETPDSVCAIIVLCAEMNFFSPSFYYFFLSPQLIHIISSSLITIDVVQLEMEDNDLIDVVVKQTGGC